MKKFFLHIKALHSLVGKFCMGMAAYKIFIKVASGLDLDYKNISCILLF